MAMAVCGLMTAHQIAAKATRDAIFLSQFDTAALPTMVAFAAIAGLVISVVRSRTLVRFGPFRITAVSFAASGILQCAEWLLLRHNPRAAACVIYVHVVAFGAILLSGFWSVMSESFDPRSAKSVFGRIGGMGTLGGLCGGVLAERVAAWFSLSAVVVALAILHLMCAYLLWRAFPSAAAPRRAAEEPLGATLLDAVHRYPFLLTLAGVVLVSSVGTAMLDFSFKAQASQTMGRGAPLLRFFGLYYTATSLFTFLAQTFGVQLCVQRAGLSASACGLPGVLALGGFAGAVFPGFTALSGIRAGEIVVRNSLFRSAYELFFTAVAPADKRAAKSVLDVGVDRIGEAVGAGGISLLWLLAPGRYGAILAAAGGCGAVALLLAMRLQRGHLQALEKSLMDRAIEVDPSMLEDSATKSVLLRSALIERPAEARGLHDSTSPPRSAVAADTLLRSAADLRSGDASRVSRAAGKLDPAQWELAPMLIDLLAWDEVMPATRAVLERMGPKITGMLVDVLLDPDRDFTIRRRVPRVLALVPSMRSVEGLFDALEDRRFEVRFYSGRALYLLLTEHPELTVPRERVWAVINGELSLQKSVWDSHQLLDRRDSNEKKWFFDDELLDRADHNLEHLFTLLALLLPADAVRVAFRALHTDDRQLKGTAFEYLESATPAPTRRLLLSLLEADAQSRLRPAAADGAFANLLASRARVNQTLKLDARAVEARR